MYFEKFDALLRDQFLRSVSGYRASIEATVLQEGVFLVEGSYEIGDAEFCARRSVYVFVGRGLVIVDDYSAASGDAPVQRFLVPSEAGITLSAGLVEIVSGELGASIRFYNGQAVHVVAGRKGASYKGWVSKRFNSVEVAYCIESKGASGLGSFLCAALAVGAKEEQEAFLRAGGKDISVEGGLRAFAHPLGSALGLAKQRPMPMASAITFVVGEFLVVV